MGVHFEGFLGDFVAFRAAKATEKRGPETQKVAFLMLFAMVLACPPFCCLEASWCVFGALLVTIRSLQVILGTPKSFQNEFQK